MIPMSEMQTGDVVPQWTLGWRLQRALSHADMKVEQMADELGISRGTASRWLNDRGPVREIYLKQWAMRCGVAFEWIKSGAATEPAGTRTIVRKSGDNHHDGFAAAA